MAHYGSRFIRLSGRLRGSLDKLSIRWVRPQRLYSEYAGPAMRGHKYSINAVVSTILATWISMIELMKNRGHVGGSGAGIGEIDALPPVVAFLPTALRRVEIWRGLC